MCESHFSFQSGAALLVNQPKWAHITPLLTELHRLPVTACIKFKSLILSYSWMCPLLLEQSFTRTILSRPICPSSAVFVLRGSGLYSSTYFFKYCFRFNNLDASGQDYSVCCSESKSYASRVFIKSVSVALATYLSL